MNRFIRESDIMPLVSMKEILKDAKEKRYAIGCYNAINLDMVRGILEAAEEENSPVILCHAEVHFKYTPLEKIAYILLNEARYSKIPVALLLDHGKSFDAIVKAMKLGFNAIMYDGSSLGYEENVKNTKEIVRIAEAMGVTVEAELGHVTRPKSGGADGDEDDSIIDDTSLFTDPKQAVEFVVRTGVDALAVAFGTAHGIYLKEPKIDIKRLKAINELVGIPLVMHGGSGLSEKDFVNSIQNGISKINYYTGLAVNAAQKLKEELLKSEGTVFYHNLMMTSIEAFREDVQKTMRLFGSSGKA
jgi:fructose-bisphosphate aldolase, class II